MYYDLDDMYSMLNEYKEQDAKQVIERQEVAEQESNAVMELHPAENSESVNSIPDQQEDTSNQEKIPRERNYELVVPVNEKSGYKKSSDRSIRVSDVDFKKSDKKASASETCALRDIPKCLVEMAKRSFPHAKKLYHCTHLIDYLYLESNMKMAGKYFTSNYNEGVVTVW